MLPYRSSTRDRPSKRDTHGMIFSPPYQLILEKKAHSVRGQNLPKERVTGAA